MPIVIKENKPTTILWIIIPPRAGTSLIMAAFAL
jgi:hypothetical protein